MASHPTIMSVPPGTNTIQKMRIRILPFIFFLFVVSFLDRTNIGFAALTMNKDLGITSEQFGLVAGIFFFGYCLFEIPSNLLLHKIGARIWIARILITWGIVAMLTGVVHTVHQLYVVRFLFGAGGSGLFPWNPVVSDLLVSPEGTGAGDCAVHDWHTRDKYPGSPGFWSDSGPRALAGREQLEVAGFTLPSAPIR